MDNKIRTPQTNDEQEDSYTLADDSGEVAKDSLTISHNALAPKFLTDIAGKTIHTEIPFKEDLSTMCQLRAYSFSPKPLARNKSFDYGSWPDFVNTNGLQRNYSTDEKLPNMYQRNLSYLAVDTQKPSIPLSTISSNEHISYPQSRTNKSGLTKNDKLPSPTNQQATRRGSNILKKIFQGGLHPSSNEENYTKAFELIHDKAMVAEADSPMSRRKRKEKSDRLRKILQKHANYKVDTGTKAFFRLLKDIQRVKSGPFGRIKYRLLKLKGRLRSVTKHYHIKSKLKSLLKPIEPESTFKFVWDLIILVMITIDLILLPFSIAFNDNLQDKQQFYDNYDSLQFAFFVFDIFLNFNTAYNFEGDLIRDRRLIAIKYLKGWFWPDVISAFPFQTVITLIQGQDNNSTRLFRVFRFLRFFKTIRIVRIIKLRRILTKSEEYIDNSTLFNGIISLVKLSMIIFFLAHWCACIWYFIGKSQTEYSWLQDSRLDGSSVGNQYVAALYFTIATMLTVGYGDISPVSLEERIFAIFIMLLGGGVFGYTLNSIAGIIQSLEDEKSKIRRKIHSTARYMQQQGINKEVQSEVKKYLDFMLDLDNQDKRSEKEILRLLPDHLKNKVDEQMNLKFVNENKILKATFSEKVTQRISSRVETRVCSSGELIYGSNDCDFSVFFILKGTVELYYDKSNTPLTVLKKSNHFGEKSFFSNLPRKVVAKSHDFSQLLFFKREAILEILKDFPLDAEMFHMTKDNITNYEKFSVLGSKCHICSQDDHIEDTCPMTAYQPEKQEIINQFLEDEKIFNWKFPRSRRNRFHVTSNLAAIEEAAGRFHELQDMKSLEGTVSDSGEIDDPASLRQRTIIIEDRNSFSNMTFKEVPTTDLKKRVIVRSNARGATEINLIESLAHEAQARLSRLLKTEYQLIEEDELEDGPPFTFDKVKNYEIYFPHNNLTKVVDSEQNQKLRKDLSEIDVLRNHLGRFFKAVDRKSDDYN